jgi:hypothetical protein
MLRNVQASSLMEFVMQHIDEYVAAPMVDVQKCPPEGCGNGGAGSELPATKTAEEESDKREL